MKGNSCIGLASHFKRGRCPEHGFCLLFALVSSRLFNSLSRVVDLRENGIIFAYLSDFFLPFMQLFQTCDDNFHMEAAPSLGCFGDFCRFPYTCNILNMLTRKYLNPFFFTCFRGKLLVLRVYSCLNALWLIWLVLVLVFGVLHLV